MILLFAATAIIITISNCRATHGVGASTKPTIEFKTIATMLALIARRTRWADQRVGIVEEKVHGLDCPVKRVFKITIPVTCIRTHEQGGLILLGKSWSCIFHGKNRAKTIQELELVYNQRKVVFNYIS